MSSRRSARRHPRHYRVTGGTLYHFQSGGFHRRLLGRGETLERNQHRHAHLAGRHLRRRGTQDKVRSWAFIAQRGLGQAAG